VIADFLMNFHVIKFVMPLFLIKFSLVRPFLWSEIKILDFYDDGTFLIGVVAAGLILGKTFLSLVSKLFTINICRCRNHERPLLLWERKKLSHKPFVANGSNCFSIISIQFSRNYINLIAPLKINPKLIA
jgi:hypothetical protein